MVASFIALGKLPFSKERLNKFSSGTLMSLENRFRSLVEIIFGPADLNIFRALILSSIFSAFVGVRTKALSIGSVR